ncbi:MAG: hypothetical protein C4520_14865 [Candidatus Abyssobacteria bacterium SURF_5]|uniref:succinate dehydrogenase n=1 Tax=Abyssobacteria bacterium (strain SURF_5) TaxID=2093360 RepID=A0A3A4NF67_ABYX5|nr:MAG: hypothetical protein C4520_14865 [Candidatus Abyssubacteria bacterium SURF_5]
MQTANVHIERYDPESGACRTETYSVELKENDTVLQALLRIYEERDSTLAFRHGCRGSRCGQCVLQVDGMPRLACATRARDGMTLSPLKNLPSLRDLIFDRSAVDRRISSQRLYVMPPIQAALGELSVPEAYGRLIGCLECYGCMASCPRFDWRDESFGGPYVFVRLALLHLDPRDQEDRRAQARALGVDECAGCSACRCVKGIAIRRDAIGMLLGQES